MICLFFTNLLRAICVACPKIQGHYGNKFIIFITNAFSASDL